MKKATAKKSTPPAPSTPATLTGIANRNFRSTLGFHPVGSTVTLTGPDATRYAHFLTSDL